MNIIEWENWNDGKRNRKIAREREREKQCKLAVASLIFVMLNYKKKKETTIIIKYF